MTRFLPVALCLCVFVAAGCKKKPAEKEQNNNAATTETEIKPPVEPPDEPKKTDDPRPVAKSKGLVVTKEEVEKVTGHKVSQVLTSGNTRVAMQATYGGAGQPVIAMVSHIRGGTVKGAFESNFRFPKVEEIKDLGKRAVWIPQLSLLEVLDDNYLVKVRVTKGKNEPLAEALKKSIALARIALTRK